MIFPDLCYGVLCYGTHRFSDLLANTGGAALIRKIMLKLLHLTIARFTSLKIPAPQWMVGFWGVFLGVSVIIVSFSPHIWSPPLPKLVKKHEFS